MNSAKKTLKAQGNQAKSNSKKKSKHAPKKNGIVSKVLFGIVSVFVVVLCILIGYEQLHKPLILKVDDTKVYLSDMMYYIYTEETQAGYYSQLFGSDASSYWNMDAGDGKTIADSVKESILNQATQYEILYKEAIKAGNKLTAAEKKATATSVTGILEQLTDDQKEKTGFTEANLTEQLNMMAVADQYKQDLIDGFDIDDAAIKATVDYDEYRQYDVEYYKVPTTTTDSDNNTTDLSAADKKAAYDKLETLYNTAKTADDFTTLISTDDTTNVIQYSGEANFIASDDWSLGDDAQTQVMKMNNGEVSGIIEGDGCYFFVKMVDNNSSESYDKAVESAISDKETEAFDKEYNNNILKNYKVKTYNGDWKKVTLGSITQ